MAEGCTSGSGLSQKGANQMAGKVKVGGEDSAHGAVRRGPFSLQGRRAVLLDFSSLANLVYR